MPTTVLAVYENGVFRPVQSVPLTEGETVQLTVTPPGVSPAEAAEEERLTPLGRIQRRLERDLPRLREQYPNMWIAYDATGMVLPPSPDKFELDRQCLAKGLNGDEFAIEGTFPEPEYITSEVAW